jgi:hypothetical protein
MSLQGTTLTLAWSIRSSTGLFTLEGFFTNLQATVHFKASASIWNPDPWNIEIEKKELKSDSSEMMQATFCFLFGSYLFQDKLIPMHVDWADTSWKEADHLLHLRQGAPVDYLMLAQMQNDELDPVVKDHICDVAGIEHLPVDPQHYFFYLGAMSYRCLQPHIAEQIITFVNDFKPSRISLSNRSICFYREDLDSHDSMITYSIEDPLRTLYLRPITGGAAKMGEFLSDPPQGLENITVPVWKKLMAPMDANQQEEVIFQEARKATIKALGFEVTK